MSELSAILAALFVFGVGVTILWANPSRLVNRSVAICSGIVALWLVFSYLATVSVENGLLWVRWTCFVGALAVLSLWAVKESILGRLDFGNRAWVLQNSVWLVAPLVLAVIPLTEAFIPAHSTDSNRVTGWGYSVYYGGLVSAYLILLFQSLRSLRHLSGAARLELQVWLGGGVVTVGFIYFLIGVGALVQEPIFRRLQPLVILFFYAGTAYAITTHRIFDARQLVMLVTEKLLLVSTVVGVGYLSYRIAAIWMENTPAYVISSVISLWAGGALARRLDELLQLFPEGVSARQAAFAAAQKESRKEDLEKSYLALLKGWGHCEHSLVATVRRDSVGDDLGSDSPAVIRALRELRWATPERLDRERATPNREALSAFLLTRQLGVIVLAEGRSLAAIVGVGVPASRRPFTYPQVTQLIELASIMESALERVHYSSKVQHAEQLATVGLLGASVAHEIRNPLVSIKTFVQLLPTHHHDPRFREKFFKLIGDEVTRIDQLTEQLLDLASPRTYSAAQLDLHPVLRSSLELVAAKAAHRQVRLITELHADPDRAYTDASAAKQVMLNLCFNAIQAVEAQPLDSRWVKLATRNTEAGIEMAVSDNGPGIAPEIRPKLFQPFQTTKSSGFGLGLAICSDILANLNASISVDPAEPGRGATFRVVFPCQPSSS